MKTLILTCLTATAVLSLCSCETDGDEHHGHARSTTTTTEETTVHRPVEATTETRTIRAY